MPYLGNEPGAITDAFTQTFTGNGSTTNFTLSQASTTDTVFVRISGVMQRNGTDFTVDGTTLAFTTAPPDLANNIVVQFFTLGSVQEIAADSVTVDKLNLVSTASVPSLEAKGDGSSQDGYIQLNCSQNSHGIKLKAPPHSAGQSYTLTYPSSIVDGGFMKTDSSGNLSFATVASGGMRFLNSTDFSGASSYDFASGQGLDASSFDCYRMIFQSVTPNSDGVYAEIRTSTDGGSTYDNSAGNYEWNIIKNRASGGNLHDNLSSAAVIELVGDNSDTDTTIGSAANEHGLSGWVDIIAPHLTTYTTFNWFLNWNTAAGELNIVVGAGRRKSAADVDAVRFIFEGGATIESGTITTYGWANA